MRRAIRKLIGSFLTITVAVTVTQSSFFECRQEPETSAGQLQASRSGETKSEHDRRMKWWREARFGIFIHWGLYAVPAGEYKGQRSTRIGEWIMDWANIPRADYEIVDSTPYTKDPMKALAVEARKQGLKFCFYYSILDWHYPSAYVDAPGKDPTAGNRTTKMRPGGKEEYVKYMKAQLSELIMTYDPAVLWFDGEWQEWWTEEDGQDLYKYVRGLKSNIIINNRVGKGRQGMQGMNKSDREYSGDFGTPEQQIPANGLPGVDWESCMTMNTTWGYKFYDDNGKSTETIVHNLIDIASKGGNYLLNVGPTAEGLIPGPSIERLIEVGKWMKTNGEAIYGTNASPIAKQLDFGRATSKPGRIYLHVFNWPSDGSLRVPTWGKGVKRAYLLASPKSKLTFAEDNDGVTIHVPSSAPDPIASVIVIEAKN